MALSYVGITGYYRGVQSAEVGINCDTFSLTIEPEIMDYLNGIDGQAIGFALGNPKGELSIEGEFNATTLAGVMLAVSGTAFVPVNSTTFFGRSQGGFYLTSAEVNKSREGWNKVSAKFSSRWGIA